MVVENGEKNTFGDQAFTTFNDSPEAIRIIDNKQLFYRKWKKYYRDSALVRTLSW